MASLTQYLYPLQIQYSRLTRTHASDVVVTLRKHKLRSAERTARGLRDHTVPYSTRTERHPTDTERRGLFNSLGSRLAKSFGNHLFAALEFSAFFS